MTILLVEDDVGIGRFVERGLRAEGYAVIWQRRAAQVLETLVAAPFVAAILDLGLPDEDGVALCRRLRSGGITTPIVMLTARAALQDKLDGFASGADDYLVKPFAFDELLARLAAVIRRGAPVASAAIRYGTVSLDPGAREAVVGEVAVPLSRREFDLLAALARAQGAVVARATLLNAVWGEDAEVSDNSIDVYVGYLRRRLAPFADAPAILAVRGRGFRLAVQNGRS